MSRAMKLYHSTKIIFLITVLFMVFFQQTEVLGASFKDDLGRIVVFESPPQRIISLAPGITEILFSLGLGDRVVGVTNFCNYPKEVLSKKKVGGLNSNFEVILSLKPDLVIGNVGVYQEEKIIRFDQFDIPFFLLDPTSLKKVFSMIQAISSMLGVEEKGQALVSEMNQHLETLKDEVSSYSPLRVLYVVDKRPLFSVGRISFINDLIHDAGGINVTGQMKTAYPLVSMEYILQKDPEVIILPIDGDGVISESQLQFWSRWTTLSAVKNGRIHTVNRDLLSRPGPRLIQGLEELARTLHPGVQQKGPH